METGGREGGREKGRVDTREESDNTSPSGKKKGRGTEGEGREKRMKRGEKENGIPAADGEERTGSGTGTAAETSVTEKRTEKEKTAPKALLYLSYNYHNRAPRRCGPIPHLPRSSPRFLPGRNRKLETLEYIFPSLVARRRFKLFAAAAAAASEKAASRRKRPCEPACR